MSFEQIIFTTIQDNQDKHLDIPAKANQEKHINFLEAEDKTVSENISDDKRFGGIKEDAERRKQWEQGLEEGRKAANENDE